MSELEGMIGEVRVNVGVRIGGEGRTELSELAGEEIKTVEISVFAGSLEADKGDIDSECVTERRDSLII